MILTSSLLSGVRLRIGKDTKFYSFKTFRVVKAREMISVTCTELIELSNEEVENGLLLWKIFSTSR